jgi:hypothetical protein
VEEKNKEEQKKNKLIFKDLAVRIFNKYKDKIINFEKLTGNNYTLPFRL